MEIPVYTEDQFTDDKGFLTSIWSNIMSQLFNNMQQDLGNEGYKIPSVSSDPNSVDPAATGGQLLQIQNSFGQQGGVQAGTLVFDPYEVNGSTPPARNGQLKIILNDGVFHPIPNI